MAEASAPIEPEVLPADEPPNLALRRPNVAATLVELAALKGEANEVIEARISILTNIRKAAIRATNPQDWLLFRTNEGTITGYLQDAGCNRVRDLWGIEVFDIAKPEKVNGSDAGEFHYLVTGSGRCKLTGQVIEHVEGGRSSKEDFCKHKAGVDLELAVRKAARANLDGNITRKLAGLQSVPIEELKDAWAGTSKKAESCTLGRGFGTQAERRGGAVREQGTPTDVQAPLCDACQKTMRFVPAGTSKQGRSYDAFWSCPDYKKVDGKPNGHSTLSDAAWRKQLAEMTTNQDDNREPGQEG